MEAHNMKWSIAIGYAFATLLVWLAAERVVLFATHFRVALGRGVWTARYPLYLAIGAVFFGFRILLRVLE
jgi:hypothetical protein